MSASDLTTHGMSILCPTLPHSLNKDKHTYLIEKLFTKRGILSYCMKVSIWFLHVCIVVLPEKDGPLLYMYTLQHVPSVLLWQFICYYIWCEFWSEYPLNIYSKARFQVKLSFESAFGTPIFYIAHFGKINHRFVSLSASMKNIL